MLDGQAKGQFQFVSGGLGSARTLNPSKNSGTDGGEGNASASNQTRSSHSSLPRLQTSTDRMPAGWCRHAC